MGKWPPIKISEVSLILTNRYERFHTFYVGTARDINHTSNTNNNGRVTIKEYHLCQCAESDVVKEVVTLAKLSSHSCMPQLTEVFITDESVFALCNQLDSCRLSHLVECRLNSKNQLSFHDTRCIIKAVMEGVFFCHSKQIIVRNLSPKNICVKRLNSSESGSSGKFDVKIADFSLAVSNGCAEYVCDSPYFNWSQVPFMAPEALLGNPYSYPMDMWSVGVLLFMMVTNTIPFQHDDDVELMHRITVSIFL